MSVIKLDELTYPKIADLLKSGKKSILWPVGTMEAHGRHAPVGTDNFCAEGIAWRLGEKLDWPVAPVLNYGITTGLIAYPGSIKLDRDIYAALVKGIMKDFFAMGFQRIVVVNGHGGNTEPLVQVVKELAAKKRGKRHMMVIDWWMVDADALKEIYGRPGGHAALDETAVIYSFRPELIDQSAATKDHESRIIPGIVSAPLSAAMLVYEDGDASPDFDKTKASKFTEKVLAKLETIVRHEVELFDKSFSDLEGL